MRINKLITIVLLSLSMNVSAWSHTQDYDTAYVHRFPQRFTLKPLIAFRNTILLIKPEPSGNVARTLVYIPNVSFYTGIGGSYRNTQFNLYFKLPIFDESIAQKGETKYRDINLGLYAQRVSGVAYYKSFKGLYLSNPADFYPAWQKTETYPLRADMEITKIGLEAYYVFNHTKYSTHAVIKQTERQKQSVGSWLLRLDVSYLSVTGDSSFVPQHLGEYFGFLWQSNDADNLTINLMPGYSFNWIPADKWFVAPFIFVGIGATKLSYGSIFDWSSNLQANLKLSAGYNGDRWFASIFFDSEYGGNTKENIQLKTESFFSKFTIGYRF